MPSTRTTASGSIQPSGGPSSGQMRALPPVDLPACPGYVVDHINALKRGGADDPSIMQWQTIEDAKAKDRVED